MHVANDFFMGANDKCSLIWKINIIKVLDKYMGYVKEIELFGSWARIVIHNIYPLTLLSDRNKHFSRITNFESVSVLLLRVFWYIF